MQSLINIKILWIYVCPLSSTEIRGIGLVLLGLFAGVFVFHGAVDRTQGLEHSKHALYQSSYPCLFSARMTWLWPR